MKHDEYHLQKQVCQYLNLQFPLVLYLSDTVASVKLNFGQQQRNKAIQKPEFKCPDVIILEPRGEYHGLLIELKKETPFLKDGVTLKTSEHLEGQQKTMNMLINKGYYCSFSWSLDMTIDIIKNYMDSKL